MSRLEQIKTNLENGHVNTVDAEWLISRVEEWEESYQELNKSFKFQTGKAVKGWEKVIELQNENQHYRRALGFYADEKNYETDVVSQWEPVTPVMEDSGEKARQALKEESQ